MYKERFGRENNSRVKTVSARSGERRKNNLRMARAGDGAGIGFVSMTVGMAEEESQDGQMAR